MGRPQLRPEAPRAPREAEAALVLERRELSAEATPGLAEAGEPIYPVVANAAMRALALTGDAAGARPCGRGGARAAPCVCGWVEYAALAEERSAARSEFEQIDRRSAEHCCGALAV